MESKKRKAGGGLLAVAIVVILVIAFALVEKLVKAIDIRLIVTIISGFTLCYIADAIRDVKIKRIDLSEKIQNRVIDEAEKDKGERKEAEKITVDSPAT